MCHACAKNYKDHSNKSRCLNDFHHPSTNVPTNVSMGFFFSFVTSFSYFASLTCCFAFISLNCLRWSMWFGHTVCTFLLFSQKDIRTVFCHNRKLVLSNTTWLPLGSAMFTNGHIVFRNINFYYFMLSWLICIYVTLCKDTIFTVLIYW